MNEVYQSALKTYLTIIHGVCVASIIGMVTFTYMGWYVLTTISVVLAFMGIYRLYWIGKMRKEADEKGIDLAEHIFSDDEDL